jgi:large subunit ribosomal protein L29
MKTSELREMGQEPLLQELHTLLREQSRLRMQKATGQLSRTHLMRQVKQKIARVKTILSEKGALS